MNLPGVNTTHRGEPGYPERLPRFLGDAAPERVTARGNVDLLREKALGLFCSQKCPGKLILETYDLACALREQGATVISGFHTPMEQECLRLLLRGKQPVIICPARSIETMRLHAEWRKPLVDGRLLILSPFAQKHRRITAETSAIRNRFVAALADQVFIAYAAPGGKTESFAGEALAWGKPVLTIGSPENAGLLEIGAAPVDASAFQRRPAEAKM